MSDRSELLELIQPPEYLHWITEQPIGWFGYALWFCLWSAYFLNYFSIGQGVKEFLRSEL